MQLFKQFRKLSMFFLASICLLFNSSFSNRQAGVGIDAVSFIIFPHIESRGDDLFLVYQIDAIRDDLKLVVGTTCTADKAYYYFAGRISFPETGNLKSIPIEQNCKFYRLAKAGSVYWLNPDNSRVKLELK